MIENDFQPIFDYVDRKLQEVDVHINQSIEKSQQILRGEFKSSLQEQKNEIILHIKQTTEEVRQEFSTLFQEQGSAMVSYIDQRIEEVKSAMATKSDIERVLQAIDSVMREYKDVKDQQTVQ